jgi:hypothetical protein
MRAADVASGSCRPDETVGRIDVTLLSPLMKALIVVFAVIGGLVVLAALGALFMHAGMMNSLTGMIAACRSMMSVR